MAMRCGIIFPEEGNYDIKELLRGKKEPKMSMNTKVKMRIDREYLEKKKKIIVKGNEKVFILAKWLENKKAIKLVDVITLKIFQDWHKKV